MALRSPHRGRRHRLRWLAAVLGISVVASLSTVAPASGQALLAKDPRTGCNGEFPRALHQTRWLCTFDDEFDGTTLDLTRWTPANSFGTAFSSGPPDSRVCYLNNPSTISVSGGHLRLSVGRVPAPFQCGQTTTQYIGGSVSGYGKFSQTYGRFEVRAQFPNVTVAGLQESLWLWPDDDTKYGPEPSSGEIDFAEAYSVRPDIVVPYIHYTPAKPDPNITNVNCGIGDLSAFHTYVLVWIPGSLTVSIDGVKCLVDRWHAQAPLPPSAPFDQPFFMALTQALGVNSNAFDPTTTPLPATTTIDYVRVWQLQGS